MTNSIHQITPKEIGVFREMVTAAEYRHIPTDILAGLAERLKQSVLKKLGIVITIGRHLQLRFDNRLPNQHLVGSFEFFD